MGQAVGAKKVGFIEHGEVPFLFAIISMTYIGCIAEIIEGLSVAAYRRREHEVDLLRVDAQRDNVSVLADAEVDEGLLRREVDPQGKALERSQPAQQSERRVHVDAETRPYVDDMGRLFAIRHDELRKGVG
jgi:hypothetical protein